MRRIRWDSVLALLAGIGLGLAWAWILSPAPVNDVQPAALRADFKDHYRSVIASAYAANGNLPRAQARLSLLRDPDPVQALNAQAQRMRAAGASGGSLTGAGQVAALASALERGIAFEFPRTPTAEITVISTDTPALLADSSEETETPQPIVAQPTLIPSTPRPTQTAPPTAGAPFELTGRDTVCDPNLPEGLLQVVVFDSRRRQLAGAKIIITWAGGEEEFFTGLKPELGNGYADFIMARGTAYSVQLGAGSEVASGLAASTCQSPDGEGYLGGIKLTFQQPAR